MSEKTKAIKIIYTAYDTMQDGSIRWKEKEAIIPFSKDMTEYTENQSYRDNMEAMILDIFESGYVFVNDKLAIPLFNIKQFMAYDEVEIIKPIISNVPQFNRNHKWHGKKKFHGKRPDDKGNQEKKETVIANAEDFPVKETENKEDRVTDKSAPIS